MLTSWKPMTGSFEKMCRPIIWCHTCPLESGVDHGRQPTYLSYIFYTLLMREKKCNDEIIVCYHLKGNWTLFYFDYCFSFKKHLWAEYSDVSGIILAILLFLIIKIFRFWCGFLFSFKPGTGHFICWFHRVSFPTIPWRDRLILRLFI